MGNGVKASLVTGEGGPLQGPLQSIAGRCGGNDGDQIEIRMRIFGCEEKVCE